MMTGTFVANLRDGSFREESTDSMSFMWLDRFTTYDDVIVARVAVEGLWYLFSTSHDIRLKYLKSGDGFFRLTDQLAARSIDANIYGTAAIAIFVTDARLQTHITADAVVEALIKIIESTVYYSGEIVRQRDEITRGAKNDVTHSKMENHLELSVRAIWGLAAWSTDAPDSDHRTAIELLSTRSSEWHDGFINMVRVHKDVRTIVYPLLHAAARLVAAPQLAMSIGEALLPLLPKISTTHAGEEAIREIESSFVCRLAHAGGPSASPLMHRCAFERLADGIRDASISSAQNFASLSLLFLSFEPSNWTQWHIEKLVALLDTQQRQRIQIRMVAAVMRIGNSPEGRETFGGLDAYDRLCLMVRAVLDGSGQRSVELLEACVSALWTLSFSARNRVRAAQAHIPELLLDLLEAQFDAKRVFILVQSVNALWQYTLLREAREVMAPFLVNALHRLLHASKDVFGADADQLRSNCMWLIVTLVCDGDAHHAALQASHGRHAFVNVCLHAAHKAQTKSLRVPGLFGLQKLSVRACVDRSLRVASMDHELRCCRFARRHTAANFLNMHCPS
jgi:hypothetical protein